MFKQLKIIIYLLPLFICFSLFSFKGFCAALPDYILDQNSLSIVQGEYGAIEEFGLSSGHVNVFTVPIFITEQLNPYLYQNYGWDLDDVADVAFSPLDPTSATTQEGIKLWSSFDPTLNSTSVIGSALENGFRVLEMKAAAVGSMARTFGTGARAFALGKINEAAAGTAAFVSDVKDNLLVKLGSNFSNLWSGNTQSLEDQGIIVNLTSSGNVVTSRIDWVYSVIHYDITCLDKSYNPANIIIYQYRTGEAGAFIPADFVYSASDRMGAVGNTKINGTEFTIDSLSTENAVTQVINGRTYYYGKLYQHWQGGGNSVAINSGYPDYNATLQFLQNYDPYSQNNSTFAYDYDTKTTSGTSFNLQQLLSQLDGLYVTSDQLGSIKTIIDDSSVVADSAGNGATQIFTDDSVQDLIDIINDIINQQDDLEDVLPDPDPDPDPSPDPDPDFEDMGISVPPDYPTTTFDTLNDVISSPLQFFSIFEPIFMIFGANTIMIFSLWLFVPCVIIIGFIIWSLK